MIFVEQGLYLRVEQNPHRPHPLPLESGFTEETAYRVLGVHSPSETSECYFILSNDRDEVWFISNRHFRVVGIFDDRRDVRIPLPRLAPDRATARPRGKEQLLTA